MGAYGKTGAFFCMENMVLTGDGTGGIMRNVFQSVRRHGGAVERVVHCQIFVCRRRHYCALRPSRSAEVAALWHV